LDWGLRLALSETWIELRFQPENRADFDQTAQPGLKPMDQLYQMIMGMADYRLGKYQQAIPWLLRAEQGGSDFCRAGAELYIAASYARLGQRGLASAALQRGNQLLDVELPRPGEADLRFVYEDWILCDVIRREAETLMKQLPAATTPIAPIGVIQSSELSAEQSQKLTEDAIADMSEDIRRNVGTSDAYSARAGLYARLGRSREAADDFAKAIDLAPDEHLYWHDGLMPLLLQVGDVQGFRMWRRKELQQFGATSDTTVAHRVAIDALMFPIDGEELTIATELAERALADPNASWRRQPKGMAEFRAGHYRDAMMWLAKTNQDGPGFNQTAVDLFLAMSYQHLNDRPQAAAVLRRATHTMDADFVKADETVVTSLQDWILCQILRREAEALILGTADTKH
jgi:tetratricopeptide (TPR) repeat protein